MDTDAFDVTGLTQLLSIVAPQVVVRQGRYFDEGWDNRLFLVNDDLVVRVAKTAADSIRLLTEARTLRVVAPFLSRPIPRPEFVFHPTQECRLAVLGYRMIAGDPLESGDVDTRCIDTLAPDLARFLAGLHRIPLESVRETGIHVWMPDQWLARHQDLVQLALGDLRRLLDRQTRSRFLTWWETYRRDPVALAFEPCFIHGDLACEHVLVERNPWRVTGVIDFGDAMIADPALDFAGFPDALARAVLSLTSHIVDHDEFWKRRDAYRRLSALHYIWAGHERDDPGLLQQGIDRIIEQFSV